MVDYYERVASGQPEPPKAEDTDNPNGERLPVDEVRESACEVTLGPVGVRCVQQVRNDHPEYGVPQKLEALVALQTRIDERRVRERLPQELAVLEGMPEQPLGVSKLVGFHGSPRSMDGEWPEPAARGQARPSTARSGVEMDLGGLCRPPSPRRSRRLENSTRRDSRSPSHHYRLI